MRSTILSDTSAGEREQQLARIGALSHADRLGRALALSALGREFTWAGARQHAGTRGLDAVRQRFLEQTYGVVTAEWVARRIAAECGP